MLKAMFTIVMRMAPIEVTTMIRLRRMEIGSSGSLARFCQARNKAPSTTLALNSPRITGESQACWRPPGQRQQQEHGRPDHQQRSRIVDAMLAPPRGQIGQREPAEYDGQQDERQFEPEYPAPGIVFRQQPPSTGPARLETA